MADIDVILERLVTEPGFRDRLSREPETALAGYELTADDLSLLASQVSADSGGQGTVEQRTSKSALFGLLAQLAGSSGGGGGRAGGDALGGDDRGFDLQLSPSDDQLNPGDDVQGKMDGINIQSPGDDVQAKMDNAGFEIQSPGYDLESNVHNAGFEIQSPSDDVQAQVNNAGAEQQSPGYDVESNVHNAGFEIQSPGDDVQAQVNNAGFQEEISPGDDVQGKMDRGLGDAAVADWNGDGLEMADSGLGDAMVGDPADGVQVEPDTELAHQMIGDPADGVGDVENRPGPDIGQPGEERGFNPQPDPPIRPEASPGSEQATTSIIINDKTST